MRRAAHAAVPVRVVIAEGHPVFRETLCRLLGEEPAIEVVGETGDGVAALALVRESEADVLVLDLAMPNLSGVDILRDLTGSASECRVIVIATTLDRREFLEVLQLGARGIVMKHSATPLLIKSIPTVMAGQYWIGREDIADLIAYMRDGVAPRPPERPQTKFGLTRRELQIVAAVVAAYSNKEIAERYSVSEDTVKHHLSHIFDKLGVSNRLEVALFAINHQLVEPADLAR